ncbi:MAG: hypothetical protein J6T15_03615 [Bacilli bacterium]|nr:hypothetical protein [Bacilli bacterium]
MGNKKNNIIEIQDMLMKQMKRLDEAVAREIPTEVGRSGALSQNAQAYLKSVATILKVKEMSRRNPATEIELMEETGIISE